MSCQSDDWTGWLCDERRGTELRQAHERALGEILLKLPDPDRKIVADLDGGNGPLSSFLAAHFARVVALDRSGASICAGETGLSPGGVDVVVVVDPIRDDPCTAQRLCARVRSALVEGGMFLAAFASRRRTDRPISMLSEEPVPADEEPGFHEVGLQYLLRRAGFQGLRLRRFPDQRGDPDTILCMAVRRACN